MRCQKQYLKNFKKGENGNFIFFLKITSGLFFDIDGGRCLHDHICWKKKRIFFDKNFLFAVEVFFILVGKLINISFWIKKIF